jgi:hypothetical protein
VGQVEPTILYNVFAKITNDGGTEAKGFKIELGTGIGANFMPSTDTDGINLVNYQDFTGKYPGGLFGGSPAEGLPFFTTESAYYYTEQVGDTLTTLGVPPQYYNLFGLWQTLANVPGAWIYDNDGRPWTDGKLVAYDEGVNNWSTFTKNWTQTDIRLILEDFAQGGQGLDPFDLNLLPDELNPVLNPYADLMALTDWMNDQANVVDTENAIRVTEVVEVLVSYLNLTKEAVDAGTLASWAAQPVTVKFSLDPNVAEPTVADAAGWPLVATWYQDRGEEGLYVMENGYEADPAFAGLTFVDGADTVITADDMATVVKDNTGANTDFFAIPGYFEDVIEDLSNVNTFFAIEIEQNAIPVATDYTMRITFVDTGDDVGPGILPPPPPVVTPTTGTSSSNSSGGGCTLSGNTRIDPTVPGILAMVAGLFGWRRFKANR